MILIEIFTFGQLSVNFCFGKYKFTKQPLPGIALQTTHAPSNSRAIKVVTSSSLFSAMAVRPVSV